MEPCFLPLRNSGNRSFRLSRTKYWMTNKYLHYRELNYDEEKPKVAFLDVVPEKPQKPQLWNISQSPLGRLVCIGCISLVLTELVDFLRKLLSRDEQSYTSGSRGEKKKNHYFRTRNKKRF